MSPIHDASGRDLSHELDNHITGHYGEDDPAIQDGPDIRRIDTEAVPLYYCVGCGRYSSDPAHIRHVADCPEIQDGGEYLIEDGPEEDCS